MKTTASQTITINIPSSEIGFTNEHLNIFGFSTEDEWTTNVTLKRNRITSYSGPLFSSNGLTTVGLSTDLGDPITGTW
jgi:hypothetical protein